MSLARRENVFFAGKWNWSISIFHYFITKRKRYKRSTSNMEATPLMMQIEHRFTGGKKGEEEKRYRKNKKA